MSSRTHVSILGVQIPLDKLASVTSTPVVYATLGDWTNYYSYSSPDIHKTILAWEAAELKALKPLFSPDPPFKAIASRKVVPINTSVNRKFFEYAPLTPRTPDLKPWE
jgi:hypothetical protein